MPPHKQLALRDSFFMTQILTPFFKKVYDGAMTAPA